MSDTDRRTYGEIVYDGFREYDDVEFPGYEPMEGRQLRFQELGPGHRQRWEDGAQALLKDYEAKTQANEPSKDEEMGSITARVAVAAYMAYREHLNQAAPEWEALDIWERAAWAIVGMSAARVIAEHTEKAAAQEVRAGPKFWPTCLICGKPIDCSRAYGYNRANPDEMWHTECKGEVPSERQ